MRYVLGVLIAIAALFVLYAYGFARNEALAEITVTPMSEALGQERELWPADMGCVTVRTTLAVLASSGLPIVSAVRSNPETREVTITSIAPGVPTSLNHLFRNGCLVEIWEEPLERPGVRGVPA